MRPEDREPYEGEPCTCTDECPADCKGDERCKGDPKCMAHRIAYQDYLSDE